MSTSVAVVIFSGSQIMYPYYHIEQSVCKGSRKTNHMEG